MKLGHAPTDRPLPATGRDTRPGIVLLCLYDHGPQWAPAIARRLVLPLDTVRATIAQLYAAEFAVPSSHKWPMPTITRHGRAYLGFILGYPLPERRRPVGLRGAEAFSHAVNWSQSL